MSENNNSCSSSMTTSPLLEFVGGSDGGERRGGWWRRWWGRVVDVEEMKKQVLFGLPMILTNVCYYAIPLVSVMFAGHLGELDLAGATLANSWATVTGFAFMIGQSGALETLCGQGYGAKMYRMLGIYLQASSIISLFFSFVISIIWFYTEPILNFLHQSHDISKAAALYMKFLMPAIFAYGFLQNILRFLQTQSVVWPLVICSGLPLLLHFGIAYAMVHMTNLGYKGAPLAASISLWLSTIMLAVYVNYAKRFQDTWKGFSSESFSHVLSNLKLALPSAAMVCLEYWAFEILVLLAGLMPNSETTTSLIAMCVNTEAISFMIAYGLSAAASTRVSNELGAGNPDQAKHAVAVTLKITSCFALAVVILLALCHNIWAGFFTDSTVMIKNYAYMTPLLVVSILLDNAQGVLSGVARGCGWQHTAMYINLATFYLIGMPIAVVLAFKLKLYSKGLWIGLICGLSCQAAGLLFITLRSKWTRLELHVNGEKENPELIN